MNGYSVIIGNLVADVADSDRVGFTGNVTAYMQEKKQNYSGLGYIEQLEKNYIYHERSLATLIDHLNMFLLGQTRTPRKEQIELELNKIRLTKRDESAAHLRYLAFGCDGCDYHHDHNKFSKLRELRLADLDGYLDEMELGCQFYTASTLLCQGCLAALWQQPTGLFDGSFDWDKRKMNDMLYQYIKYTVSAILNNTPLRDQEGKLLNYIVLS